MRLNVGSMVGVKCVEVRMIDPKKQIEALLTTDGKILQYRFPDEWTVDDAKAYVVKRGAVGALSAVMQAEFEILHGEEVKQAQFLPAGHLESLKKIDPDPYFGVAQVKYGLGSNKQSFEREFFEKAGPKFVGTHLLLGHSKLVEFGDARSVGSVVQYIGAGADAARFGFYLNSGESGLRSALRASGALKEFGAKFKVSIEGLPRRDDFKVDPATGVKQFHDLSYPTGLAIVMIEGLAGSQIIS